jgi:hypothetical protein
MDTTVNAREMKERTDRATEMKERMDREREYKKREDKKKMEEQWEKKAMTPWERDMEELGMGIAEFKREIADAKKIFEALNI